MQFIVFSSSFCYFGAPNKDISVKDSQSGVYGFQYRIKGIFVYTFSQDLFSLRAHARMLDLFRFLAEKLRERPKLRADIASTSLYFKSENIVFLSTDFEFRRRPRLSI